MHDVLIHYLEVNFADIADQLAHATAAAPTREQEAAAAERLRQVIRHLRGAARQPASVRAGVTEGNGSEHEAVQAVNDMLAAIDGSIDLRERGVFEHFFDLFAGSMQRTRPEAPTPPSAPPAPAQPAPNQTETGSSNQLADAQPATETPPEPARTDDSAAPIPTETQAAAVPSRLVGEQMGGALQTVLLAAAQQALDLLQVDASQVYTVGDDGKFVLRAGVPTDSLAAPEAGVSFSGILLPAVLEQNDVLTVEDLAGESLAPEETAWLDAGYHGFAAIALSPPLERPVGVLALLRRTPWRLDRRDAVRLEDLAAEAVAALRAHSLAVKVEEVAVLQERLKLAREIHDGLASDLAAVVALFKYYEQRRERDPQDAAQLLPQLRSMAEEILASARNILQSLRPKTIRSEGLLASVLKLVDQFGRMHLIETNASIRGEENGLTPEQKEGIFQVLREILSNVRKHSQARNVWVTLDLSNIPWILNVRDDGRGFDVRHVAEDPRKAGSYGLVGMRERAELMGGTVEIVSHLGEGTAVTFIGPSEAAG
ncbi:MAG: sensor histidine kinase [Chloroflexi bacterium]|nr:MAG: sensor histidine kinase [Chloroflexota bacterium]